MTQPAETGKHEYTPQDGTKECTCGWRYDFCDSTLVRKQWEKHLAAVHRETDSYFLSASQGVHPFDPPREPELFGAPLSRVLLAIERLGYTIHSPALSSAAPANEKSVGLAQLFHEAYERLAPSFAYETRKASAVPWEKVPEKNRKLMTAVCDEILGPLLSDAEGLVRELEERIRLVTIQDGIWKGGHPKWASETEYCLKQFRALLARHLGIGEQG